MQSKFYTCQITAGMVVNPSIFEVPPICKVLSCEQPENSDRAQSRFQYFVCLQDAVGNEFEFYIEPDHEWAVIPDEEFQLLKAKL